MRLDEEEGIVSFLFSLSFVFSARLVCSVFLSAEEGRWRPSSPFSVSGTRERGVIEATEETQRREKERNSVSSSFFLVFESENETRVSLSLALLDSYLRCLCPRPRASLSE